MDAVLIDALDSVTRWAQRRGTLLTGIALRWSAAVFLLEVGGAALRSNGFLMLVNGAVFGLWVLADTIRFKQYLDYPISVEMCKQLNAEVLRNREQARWLRVTCIFVVILPCLALGVLDFTEGSYRSGIMTVASSTTMVGYFYLRCCVFLGPGDHSSKLAEQELDNAELLPTG